MPRKSKPKAADQLDLFIADLVDVPVKGERETLSLPFFSLSKGKRSRMTYERNGALVDVSAPAHIGIANIWDSDVLLWCASEIIAARERGRETSPRLSLRPYELMKATGRDTGGGSYKQLQEALQRLKATTVRTNVRGPGGDRTVLFSWLERVQIDRDVAGNVKAVEITLPQWFYDAVMNGTVLTLSPEYFQITSGLERWLYRLVRRHAGNQSHGWTFSMDELHRKSGSSRVLKYFARDLRQIVAANALPEYHLELVVLQGGPGVHAVRRSLLALDHPAAKAEALGRHKRLPKL
jgi:plasmid replication initiation protein